MKTNVVKTTKNPFLSREEVLLEIHNDVSPSLEEIKQSLGKESDCVVIRRVHSQFGKRRFIAEVMVYDSKDAREQVETIPKKVKKKMEEERKAAEEAKKKEAAAKKAEEEAAKQAEAAEAEQPAEVAEEKSEAVTEAPAEEKAEGVKEEPSKETKMGEKKE